MRKIKSMNELELFTDDNGDAIAYAIEEIPEFDHLLIDDVRQLVFWRVEHDDITKIIISSFYNWYKYFNDIYQEVMSDEE